MPASVKGWSDLFIKCPDIGEAILQPLDVESALACRMVCTEWRHLVNNFKPVWRKFYKSDFFEVVKSGNQVLTAELLIAKGGKGADVNSFSDKVDKADMWKPLHLSALQNHTEMMEVLIRCGAEVNIPNGEKATPLHYAVEYGNLEAASLLIEKGAKVNARTSHMSFTPLHIAARDGKIEMIQLLLSEGADQMIRDSNQQCPIKLAVLSEQIEALQILIRSYEGTLGPYSIQAPEEETQPDQSDEDDCSTAGLIAMPSAAAATINQREDDLDEMVVVSAHVDSEQQQDQSWSEDENVW